MSGIYDSFQRPVNYLRISVTDRCNLRCVYCVPDAGICPLPHGELLSCEEISFAARAAAGLGISKIRVTGGEPLLRPDLPRLIGMLSGIEGIDDISMTTNGVLLGKYAAALKSAGLRRVNISLDTLRPERFDRISRSAGKLGAVMEGIEAARNAGLNPVKLNMVVMSGVNDDEVIDFARKTLDESWHVRFIEEMPFTLTPNRNEFTRTAAASQFMPVGEIKKRIETLGELQPHRPEVGNGPARYYRLPGARGTIGFITPVSEHFCFSCNRMRLTSDGKLQMCLLGDSEVDLKTPLRRGISFAELQKLFAEAIAKKPLRHRLAEKHMPRRPMSQVGG